MSDGLPTPTCHDGTGYFKGSGDTSGSCATRRAFIPASAHGPVNAYDRVAQGGVTVSHFDPGSGKLKGSALVLNGTDNNCNGGVDPLGHLALGRGEHGRPPTRASSKKHGYVFEVPARATSTVEPVPIKAMGRFVHEACPVDPKTGIVYMTEDNGDPGDGFYRYLPHHTGKLHRGGKLQMLAIKGKPGYNTTHDSEAGREARMPLGRHRGSRSERRRRVPAGRLHAGPPRGRGEVHGPRGRDLREGQLLLHRLRRRPDAEQGQIWRYTPDNKDLKRGTLELLYTSPRNRVLNGPDGIAVSPRGGILALRGRRRRGRQRRRQLGARPDPERQAVQLRQGDREARRSTTTSPPICSPTTRAAGTGRPARARASGASEARGAGFSPDGKWLFVHLQYPGETFAITGPWDKGWL